jgi:two-component system LytT family response regulator
MESEFPIKPLVTLVIDPDVGFLRELKNMIAEHPLLTLAQACRTGKMAQNHLRAEKVDLIILNPALPDMNGFDLIMSLQDIPPTIVLADRMDYAYYAFRIGAFDYRTKPMTVNQFRQSLNRVFRAVRQDRELKALREQANSIPSNPTP